MKELLKTVKKLARDKRVRFLITGMGNTLFSFFVYAYLIFYDVYYPVATTISFFLTVILSYFLNKYFTFKEKRRSTREVIIFLFVYMISYIINVSMLYYLCDLLHMDNILAQIICTPAVVVVSYVGHNKFSFSGRQYN